MTIEEAKQYILEGRKITEEQALSLANHPDKEALYEAAHQITRHFMGNKFDTCSIINAKSGNCSEDCKWCAQSGHYKTLVNLYPLLPAKECVYHAVYNRKQGIRRFALVTSGKRVSDKELEQITDTIRQIKQQSDIKCIPLNLLQPIPGTPMENTHILEEEEWLTTIALFRLINPNAFLRFSGGRAQLSEATQRKSLYIGINSAIIGDLLTTIGSKVEEDKVLFTSEGYSLTENTDWEK